MWVRMRFDIEWPDLSYGIAAAGRPLDRQDLEGKVAGYWSAPEQAFACLSVRSGFDMFWAAHRLPPGSEVLMSALTIPDMVRIVEHHGLAAVPLDLDVSRMAPRLDLLEGAITPRTRAVVVAHLFGTRVPMDPIVQVARRHGLLVVEDCAQAFAGRAFEGHPESDAVMFSFGPIKTSTALGGAVLHVRDPEILRRMRSRQATYPVQQRSTYAQRLLKYSALKAASSRPLCDAILSLSQAAELNHDHLINSAVRGFSGPRFFERIRRQPSEPLLALLARRLWTFDPERLKRRAARGEFLVRLLSAAVRRPGSLAPDHTHWVFPIMVEDPPGVIAALGRAGFDATQGGSLRVIPPPADRPDLTPHATRSLARSTVFLPLCRQMPARSVRRMAEVITGLNGLVTAEGAAGSGGFRRRGRGREADQNIDPRRPAVERSASAFSSSPSPS